jgi:SAM-dependent methyltransferase
MPWRIGAVNPHRYLPRSAHGSTPGDLTIDAGKDARLVSIPMSARSDDDSLAAFYQLLWPKNESADPRFALLESDGGGRAIEEILYELASQAGISRTSVVLDVGCGKGHHACEIAKKLSCRVIATDPLEHCLALGRKRAEREGVAERVEFRAGDLETLPAADGEIDLVWCLDTFNHARDIAGSFRQFARVLGPEGITFICSALETSSLEPREKEWLCRTLSLNPATLSQPTLEKLLASNGLRVLSSGSTTERESQFFERIGDGDFLYVEKLARMARDERRLVEAFGVRDYEILKAHALWNAYLLIGKIRYHVWVIGRDL